MRRTVCAPNRQPRAASRRASGTADMQRRIAATACEAIPGGPGVGPGRDVAAKARWLDVFQRKRTDAAPIASAGS